MTFTSETAIAGPPGRETREHEALLSSWAVTAKTGLQGWQGPFGSSSGKSGLGGGGGGRELPEARSLVGDLSLLRSLGSWLHLMTVSEDISRSRSKREREENSLNPRPFG